MLVALTRVRAPASGLLNSFAQAFAEDAAIVSQDDRLTAYNVTLV